jgi:hypothetical protein
VRGKRLSLTLPRRLIGDLMHFAAGVPTVPVQRRMDLAAVAAARAACPDRPPWPAVFAKGFSLVAAEFPELRRAYCNLPWPHLYEYPVSVVCFAIEREYRGERAVLPFVIKDFARRPLSKTGQWIRAAATRPLEGVTAFRRALRVAGLPRLVRRPLWWAALNLGRVRANYFGTFAVTAYPGRGAESLHPLTPLTATLTYGLIGPDGRADVRLVYDHRVLDGATVARALTRMEQVLNTAVAAELRGTPLVQGPVQPAPIRLRPAG